ncbi:MAG: hypothetical protein WEB63_01155 [Cucumibacter sp.]
MTANILNPMKKIARAGLIALALGGAGLVVTPAQAASSSASFSFSFNFPNGTFSFSNQGGHHFRRACATLREVYWGFQRHGYDDIEFGRQNGPWVIVTASQGRWEYTYRVNRCTWQVILLDRHRQHRHNDNWGGQQNWNWNQN